LEKIMFFTLLILKWKVRKFYFF